MAADPTAALALELLARGLPVRLRALGASMRPAVQSGDVLILAPDAERAQVGDLVLVPVGEFGGDFGVVHRIVARLGDRVCVKGDAMAAADGWYDRRQLRARVAGIERGGRLVGHSATRAVIYSLATGPVRRLRDAVRVSEKRPKAE